MNPTYTISVSARSWNCLDDEVSLQDIYRVETIPNRFLAFTVTRDSGADIFIHICMVLSIISSSFCTNMYWSQGTTPPPQIRPLEHICSDTVQPLVLWCRSILHAIKVPSHSHSIASQRKEMHFSSCPTPKGGSETLCPNPSCMSTLSHVRLMKTYIPDEAYSCTGLALSCRTNGISYFLRFKL